LFGREKDGASEVIGDGSECKGLVEIVVRRRYT